jgi:ribulose-5-phosphate 4-epimerase/fuculose-1-phosphate aldolase
MNERTNSAVNSRKETGRYFLDRSNTAENVEQLKYKLALANRIVAMKDLDEGGISGHISLRVPGSPGLFWVNPFGMLCEEVTPGNLIKVDANGNVVEGNHPVNVAGFCIHSTIHEMYPDINCVVHTHSPWGTIFSALDIPLAPIDQNCCMFFENHAVYDEYNGPVIDLDDSEKLAGAIGDNKAVILRNHGTLTCGESVETAIMYMVALERACRINILAMNNGIVKSIDPDVARDTKDWISNPMGFQIEFNALSRKAENKYPDLLSFKC